MVENGWKWKFNWMGISMKKLAIISLFLLAVSAFGQAVNRTELRNTNDLIRAQTQPLKARLTEIADLGNSIADYGIFYDTTTDTVVGHTYGANLSMVGTDLRAIPSGSDTQVPFNDGGAFGADAGMTYNKTTDTFNVRTQLVIGATSLAGSIWMFDDQGNAAIRLANVINRDLNIGSTNGQDNLVFWAKEIGVDNPIRMNFDGWDFTGPHLLFYKLAARAPTGWSEPLVDVKSTNGLQFFLIDSNGNFGIRTNAPQAALHVVGDVAIDGGITVNRFATDLLIVTSNTTEFAATAYVKHDLNTQGTRLVITNSMTGNMVLSLTNIAGTTNHSFHFVFEGEAAGGTDRFITNTVNSIGNTIPVLLRNGTNAPAVSPLVWKVPAGTVLEGDIDFTFQRGTNFGNALTNLITR